MLAKLKGQLEEMKSKVQFLGLVKKYLQVSRPALFPSLACFLWLEPGISHQSRRWFLRNHKLREPLRSVAG